ncbi:memo-like protein-domain-containing protein [Catenaria anguillulae PL171]|uniref:Memo-like protein-domain-containing protein n=1 Tax=Catenaria anguillulae PL171 TaxID=765915 RepID=A0A1Y2HT24_9FUNG|nr:memo-like protein-domain-containing protein [Catenaria anguillulae PL171]
MAASDNGITRLATHAGSWYLDDAAELDKQLSDFLAAAKVAKPTKNARILIAPHAGYSYSGATAAHAYAHWDISSLDRVIVLGPSHHVPLSGCALSRCTQIATPLGNLPGDMDTTHRLATSYGGHFTWMSKSVDEAEHSLEMHFPYIAKVFKDASRPLPLVTQILVGDLTPELDRVYGDLIARELADPAVGLVVSSDFCHWGQRFRFTHYTPTPTALCDCSHPRAHHHHHDAGHHANCADPASVLAARNAVPIHQSIEALDRAGMHIIERLDLPAWIAYLNESKNTVCGRNPIRLALVALNDLYEASLELAAAFVKYAQSSRVAQLKDSSVSYASAYATVPEGVERILAADADANDMDEDEEREVLRGDESTHLGDDDDDMDEEDASQATSSAGDNANDVDAEGDSRMGEVEEEDERDEEK